MSAPRLVVVLFADLVSSTETVARLGPEAGEAWRKRFLGVMREALAATRGREVQHTGDGLFAAFEGASDAVACGVGLQQRVARASQRRDAEAPAEARVGIAVGEAREDAEGVHGLVVVEAARLCASAKPGQILTAALVEALAAEGPRRFVPVGELSLKGLPAPVAAREVTWTESEAPIPLSARLALAQGLFVGRAAERGRLDAALEGAQRGERRLVLLAGEPGIGKTRLASERARDAHGAGAIVLDGRCDEDLGAPFQPWVQALAHLVAHAPEAELRRLLGEEALAATRLLPGLRRRLPDLPEPPAVEAESERWQLFEAIDALLAGVSHGAPVLVLLDDLHWADKPSLVLLRHLVRSQRPAALLFVGTYRETDLAPTHPLAEVLADLRREPHVERVLLRGLEEEELGALVAARAEHEAPASFLRMLHAETEGNPFFADEVLRHLVESGALGGEGARWTTDRPLAELGLPEGVREVIGRRLSRLSESANDALRVASVIGREFELPELEAASGIALEPLLDALDEASRARIVVEVPEGAGRFAFAHALIRHSLYEGLTSARRMRFHWRVGEALERRHARDLDAHASAIAHHLAEGVLAGDALRAADASLRAGERAAALVAHEEARAHFERALALLDQAGADEPERRYRAWIGQGEAGKVLADVPASRRCFSQAAEIAARSNWPERRAQAMLGFGQLFAEGELGQEFEAPIREALEALGPLERPERARLLALLGRDSAEFATDFAPIDALLQEARGIAERTGDPDALWDVRNLEAILLDGSPALERREELAAEGAEILARASRGSPVREAEIAVGSCCVAFARGDRALVQARIESLRDTSERTATRIGFTWVGACQAALALAEGRFAEAGHVGASSSKGMSRGPAWVEPALMAQLTAAAFEQGRVEQVARGVARFLETAPRSWHVYRTLRANALAELGRTEDARHELDAFEALRLPTRGKTWPLALRHLAESIALLGDTERSARLAPLCEPYAGQLLVSFTITVIEGAADRARGQCLATLGRLDEAIAAYESGLALEESFGAPALAARTRYWLARALATRGSAGDAARARAEAESARDAARGFGMALLAEQAEALAAQLR